MVVLWSWSALPLTCTEVSCPSFESSFISSVFCLIPSMLPVIMDALAVVSCMPAAISCVVAELSSAISLFACMMESSLSISVRMVVSAAVMSPISSRNTFLISLTAPAITPVSSLRFTRDSPDFVFWKSRSAVWRITLVMPVIGAAILRLKITASTTQISRHTTQVPIIMVERLTASEVISLSGADRATIIPLSSV